LWDTHTAGEVRRFEGQADSITSLAVSADGSLVVAGRSNIERGGAGSAPVWDLNTGRELIRFNDKSPSPFVAISNKDAWILTGAGNSARLLDIRTGIII
jgi:WD40 repeat protein